MPRRDEQTQIKAQVHFHVLLIKHDCASETLPDPLTSQCSWIFKRAGIIYMCASVRHQFVQYLWLCSDHEGGTEHHMTSVLTRTLNLNLTEWVKCVYTVNMIRSDPLRCEAVGRMSSSFFHSVSGYRSIFCLSLILYISLSHSRCVTEGRIQG